MSPVVVLIGAPGSGKSSVGRAVAELLGVGFRDTDEDIEAAVGTTISDQFVNDGEAVFREREVRAVAAALAEHDGVLSLGGGAVLSADTRSLLADQPVVWLQVSASTAAERVGLAASRPVLMGNVRSRLVSLLAERSPLYEEASTWAVPTDGQSVPDLARTVVGLLDARS